MLRRAQNSITNRVTHVLIHAAILMAFGMFGFVGLVSLGSSTVLAAPAAAKCPTGPNGTVYTGVYDCVDCSAGANAQSTICKTGKADPITGANGIIKKVTRILAIIAGAVAVILIVVSGIRYIVSGGDPSQITQSKKTLIYAIVGLIVIILAQSIINVVISRI